jgi:hypothetical protein
MAALDDPLDLAWHADQQHPVPAGLEPELDRGRLANTIAMLRHNGPVSLRRKRRA